MSLEHLRIWDYPLEKHPQAWNYPLEYDQYFKLGESKLFCHGCIRHQRNATHYAFDTIDFRNKGMRFPHSVRHIIEDYAFCPTLSKHQLQIMNFICYGKYTIFPEPCLQISISEESEDDDSSSSSSFDFDGKMMNPYDYPVGSHDWCVVQEYMWAAYELIKMHQDIQPMGEYCLATIYHRQMPFRLGKTISPIVRQDNNEIDVLATRNGVLYVNYADHETASEIRGLNVSCGRYTTSGLYDSFERGSMTYASLGFDDCDEKRDRVIPIRNKIRRSSASLPLPQR
jgi:hypothetical protein